MKTTNSIFTATHTLARRAPILATAASLLLAPCLSAQSAATPAPGTAAQPAAESMAGSASRSSLDELPPNHPARAKLYNLKFDGGMVSKLRDSLHAEFPADNIVLSETVDRLSLPAFELRNVSLSEIGRTIEFLGEGQMEVEVATVAGNGNIWRIGRRNLAANAATVKMRSVAGSNLFGNKEALNAILEAAEEMEMKRLNVTSIMSGVRGVFRGATVTPLTDQKLFVIVGDEEGVAGLESLIKAAEQRLAETTNAKAAALAANGPKMRAVLAPHLFADERRWKGLLDQMQKMRSNWEELNIKLRDEFGTGEFVLPWVDIDAHKEQKLFTLIGPEAAIAGMESLIHASEQLAAEEDALLHSKMEESKEKEAAKEDKSGQ